MKKVIIIVALISNIAVGMRFNRLQKLNKTSFSSAWRFMPNIVLRPFATVPSTQFVKPVQQKQDGPVTAQTQQKSHTYFTAETVPDDMRYEEDAVAVESKQFLFKNFDKFYAFQEGVDPKKFSYIGEHVDESNNTTQKHTTPKNMLHNDVEQSFKSLSLTLKVQLKRKIAYHVKFLSGGKQSTYNPLINIKDLLDMLHPSMKSFYENIIVHMEANKQSFENCNIAIESQMRGAMAGTINWFSLYVIAERNKKKEAVSTALSTISKVIPKSLPLLGKATGNNEVKDVMTLKPHELLGVVEGASIQEIEHAYFAKRFEAEQSNNSELVQKLTNAHNALKKNK